MKAAWYERQGPARDVLEVRIRIAASGINPGDIKKRENAFGYGMPYPRVIPHSDGSGHVDQLGAGVFPLNGWAVQYGVMEPNPIARLVRQRS